MPLGGDSRTTKFLKHLRGVRLLHGQHVADQKACIPPTKELIILEGGQFEKSQILDVHGERRIWKVLWDQRPLWLRPVYSGNEGVFYEVPSALCCLTFGPFVIDGDHTLLETVANVATSIPFVVIGLRTPRTNLATTMYSNSMIGVGMASTLYHTSRGKVRGLTRWGDYAMIATSTLCMSAAVKKDRNHPRSLMLASVVLLPFQPMLVTALHTALMEATFARKVLENPKLRGVHTVHTASTLVGGALFLADDVYPNTPYIHAAWHIAAAVGVMTLNTLIE